MPLIQTLSPHVANLIAAGEVVERPASVVKELLENAVDAGAKHVTVELQNGGVTFIRVMDDGCGMEPQDAETAFLRHATSKLRTESDLAAIGTLGFRGEALAAISSVSRIDLLTRRPQDEAGTSLHLEAGVVTERSEAGCPAGTTILVRDLFYNTPARMKFLKRDSVEGGAAAAAVQKQALAHPEVSIRLLMDSEERFQTAGDGDLRAALYAVLGRQLALDMLPVRSSWGNLTLEGFISKPTATRGNRSYQLFFVNDRPVVSRQLIAALEQAYENQLLKGRFPAAVLHLSVPAEAVDVNVHPAKTEVKFLAERDVFDCVHYGVQGALNGSSVQTARPEIQLKPQPAAPKAAQIPQRQENFFQSMRAQDLKAYTEALRPPKKPGLAQPILRPGPVKKSEPEPAIKPVQPKPPLETMAVRTPTAAPDRTPAPPAPQPAPRPEPEQVTLPEPEQETLPLPKTPAWRFVGEVMDSFLVVEEGDSVLFVDKHAAHERILFDKFRSGQEIIMGQQLLAPMTIQFDAQDAALLLANAETLLSLGYELEDFGGGTLLLRQIPSSIDLSDAQATLEELCDNLKNGKSADFSSLRDELLHTVACKAAIKAGWKTGRAELESLCRQVMENEDLRYCPHGRPICISLSRSQLERQFKRS